MERRTLPARKNRGKNPSLTKQEEYKTEYVQPLKNRKKCKNVNKDINNAQLKEHPLEAICEQSTKGLIMEQSDESQKRANYMNLNKVTFPYPRGYHYFYDLLTF